MPVLSKEEHETLLGQLTEKVDMLLGLLEPRKLKCNIEGAPRRRHWVNPDRMCATKGTRMELAIAVESFKGVLAEVKKLKE